MPSRRASVVAAQAMPDIAAVAMHCTCLNLRRITRKVTQRYDEWLAPSGLRATQFSLLGILHAPGEVSISGLAERMDIDRTTLTRNLQLLAEQGLVAIGTGSDPRSRTVSVTPKGRLIFQKALPLWRKAQDEVNAKLGDEGVLRLHQTLRQASARLGSD